MLVISAYFYILEYILGTKRRGEILFTDSFNNQYGMNITSQFEDSKKIKSRLLKHSKFLQYVSTVHSMISFPWPPIPNCVSNFQPGVQFLARLTRGEGIASQFRDLPDIRYIAEAGYLAILAKQFLQGKTNFSCLFNYLYQNFSCKSIKRN